MADAATVECVKTIRSDCGARSEERVTIHLPMDLGRFGRILDALAREGFEWAEYEAGGEGERGGGGAE